MPLLEGLWAGMSAHQVLEALLIIEESLLEKLEDYMKLVGVPLTPPQPPKKSSTFSIFGQKDEGLDVVEERYAIDQWRADAESGKLVETLACGTAAVVTPVGKVTAEDYSFEIGSGGPGQLTQKLRERLVGIQTGTVEDRHGWITKLG